MVAQISSKDRQAPDQGQQDHGRGGRHDQRQGDVPEVLPLGRPVDPGRLVVLLWDADQTGDEDQRGDADALPDVDQRDAVEGQCRIGQPAGAGDPEHARGSC